MLTFMQITDYAHFVQSHLTYILNLYQYCIVKIRVILCSVGELYNMLRRSREAR